MSKITDIDGSEWTVVKKEGERVLARQGDTEAFWFTEGVMGWVRTPDDAVELTPVKGEGVDKIPKQQLDTLMGKKEKKTVVHDYTRDDGYLFDPYGGYGGHGRSRDTYSYGGRDYSRYPEGTRKASIHDPADMPDIPSTIRRYPESRPTGAAAEKFKTGLVEDGITDCMTALAKVMDGLRITWKPDEALALRAVLRLVITRGADDMIGGGDGK